MAPTRSAPDAPTLRPWQFFTLLALGSATAAVFLVRNSRPENIILICLAIGAAALVGLGALRTLRPLVSPDAYEPEMVGNRTRAALEREKNLILRAIKELEFDHAMGKVANADFEDMTLRLRARAVRLLKQLDSEDSGYREIIERELASRLGKAVGAGPEPEVAIETVPGSCGTCGTSNDTDARFCKQCGARLLLLIFAVLMFGFGGTAWAQAQMPDPRQMAGIPRPVTDLADGHISVRLIRGQLTNNIPGHPVDLHAGGKVVTVKTDEAGRAEFSGIPAGTPVKAAAVVDGERLESQEFPAPGQGGIRLLLVATPKGAEAASGSVVLGDQTRVILDLANDALQVYYLLDIRNEAGTPVSPAPALSLDMPAEALGTSLVGGGAQAVVEGRTVTVPGPFAPGQTTVQVGYQLPLSGSRMSLTQKFPVPVGTIAVLMRKVGEMTLESPQLPDHQEREFQGDHYVMGQGPAQAAGSALTLNLSGLPHHSRVPRTIALGLACLIVGAGVVAAARVPQQGGDAARLKQLRERREKIFSELVRLEQQRQKGSVEAARYAERRPALIAQLERVYRDLDAEGGQGLAA